MREETGISLRHERIGGRLFLTAATSAIAGALASAPAAFAQAQDQAADDSLQRGPAMLIEEIVVTARKREESLQEVPLAITAFTEQALEARNIDKLMDVGRFVPNLNITRFGVGNPSATAIFIRGIGIQDHIITTDPAVALYVDGVYLGRQMGSNLDLTNIERVEVLRGPQGTLYGRNSIGGAVNIITKKPGEEESFELTLQGGSRLRVGGGFSANFRLAEDVGMSVQGHITRREGVGDALMIVNPSREIGEIFEASGRFAINWQASDDFSLLWTVDANQGENGQSPSTSEIITGLDEPGIFAASGGALGFFTDPIGPAVGLPGGPLKASDITRDPDDTNTSVERLLKQSNTGIGTALTADWLIDDNYSLKLLSSFRHMDYDGGLDDETAFQDFQSFPESGEADQVSVEVQFNGEFETFNFVAGLFYFREEGDTFSGPNTFIAPGGFFDINQDVNSYAAYAHGNVRLLEDLNFGLGVRWSLDNKDADALFSNWPVVERVFRNDEWNELTWDLSLTYNLADDMTAFYQESKGYQNGGFPARPFGGPETFVSFDPVTARNHEGGFRGRPFDFLQTSVSFFWTRYFDLPLQFSMTTPEGFVTITENAGRSESIGFDFENTVQFGGFSLTTALGWIDAEVKKVNPGVVGVRQGEEPSLTPSVTLAIGPQYEHVFDNGDTLTVRADYSFRDDMFGQSVNNEFNRLDKRDLLNFRVEYVNAANGWSLAAYGDNVWNEQYDVGRLDQPFSGFTEIIRNNDRSEFGLIFTKFFDLR